MDSLKKLISGYLFPIADLKTSGLFQNKEYKMKMKSAFINILLLLLSKSVMCQMSLKVFHLKGSLLEQSSDSFQVTYVNGSGAYIKKSIHVINGHFELTDSINEPTRITIRSSAYKKQPISENEVEFFIEPGVDSITIRAKHFWNPQGPFNFTNTEYTAFAKILSTQISDFDSAISYIESTAESELMKNDTMLANSLVRTSNFIQKLRTGVYTTTLLDFIKSHPASHISVRQFFVLTNHVDIDTLLVLYSNLSEEIKRTATGKAVAETLQNISATRSGHFAPDLKATDNIGRVFNLKELWEKGPVLIDFWASWCVPCIADMPSVKRLENEFAGKGFKVVFISIDGKRKESWLKAIENNGLEQYQNFIVLGNGLDEITKTLAVQAIPDKILIDQTGKIVYRKVGAGTQTLEEALDQLFNTR